MSRLLTGRLTVAGIRQTISRPPCSIRATTPQWTAAFSSSASRRADEDRDANNRPNPLESISSTSPGPQQTSRPVERTAMDELASASSRLVLGTLAKARNAPLPDDGDLAGHFRLEQEDDSQEPYHLHVYSHKHNTHITVTKPNRDAIVSMSCGNIGFRKSNRKQYDAAYQLGAHVLDRLYRDGWHKKIKKLEVVLRGFGAGREAVTKLLLGTEGKMLRSAIVRVTDSTRLKFGGTRSRKPRRLG
ncbi:hypothetical protein VTK73DRAFT_9293 [Phialemonium thermophilum]|uniref:Uncharacterized protein n=1 Tax=Phialemonium thermophilum TaxID=223376 RepID=A0ABR3XLJ4_9PEZI